MHNERIVRLFRSGGNQAILIPRDFELASSEALIRKEGDRLIIEPIPRLSLLSILSTWAPLEEEFPDVDDLSPLEDVNL